MPAGESFCCLLGSLHCLCGPELHTDGQRWRWWRYHLLAVHICRRSAKLKNAGSNSNRSMGQQSCQVRVVVVNKAGASSGVLPHQEILYSLQGKSFITYSRNFCNLSSAGQHTVLLWTIYMLKPFKAVLLFIRRRVLLFTW